MYKAIITDKRTGQTTTVAKGSYEECAIKLSRLRFVKYKEWTYHNDTNIKGYIIGKLTEEEVFGDDIETICNKDELLREEEFHQKLHEKKKVKEIAEKKINAHKEICDKLNNIYEQKNHDYGDSFAKLRVEIPDAILVRIYDKYSRLKTLMDGTEQKVKGESIDDTLMDLANYCIMELIERDDEKNV